MEPFRRIPPTIRYEIARIAAEAGLSEEQAFLSLLYKGITAFDADHTLASVEEYTRWERTLLEQWEVTNEPDEEAPELCRG